MIEKVAVSVALVMALMMFWLLLIVVAQKREEDESALITFYLVGWATSSWVLLYLLWR